MKDSLSLQQTELDTYQLTMVKVDAMLKRAKKAAHEASDTLKLKKKMKPEKNDKKLKKQTKDEKHISDNQKRIKIVKEKEAAAKNQKKTIQAALSSTDSSKANKKIKFDSDSEDDVATPGSRSEAANLNQPRETTVGKRPKLFDDDGSGDGSDSDDDGSGDGSDSESDEGKIDFSIRKQYEGPTGRKLMKLQSTFKGDDRFKFDEKFITSDVDDSDDSSSDVDDTTSITVKTPSVEMTTSKIELQRNLGILASVVGKSVQRLEQKPSTALFKESIRYDPSRDDHQAYVVRDKNAEEAQVEKKKAKKKEKVKTTVETIPEVSKESFYKVESVVLKSALADRDEDKKQSVFNFFGGEDDDDLLIDNDTVGRNDNSVEEATPSNPFDGFESVKAKYESSSESESEESAATSSLVETSTGTKAVESFFFLPDDPKIKEGIESFYAKEDPDEVRRKWQERREDLIELFKTLKRKRRSQNRVNMARGGGKRGRRVNKS